MTTMPAYRCIVCQDRGPCEFCPRAPRLAPEEPLELRPLPPSVLSGGRYRRRTISGRLAELALAAALAVTAAGLFAAAVSIIILLAETAR